MLPIIDMHAHAQDVQNEHHRRTALRRARRLVGWRGPIWLWEKLHYNPRLAGEAAGPMEVLTALETQLRLTRGDPKILVATMAKAGVGRAVVLPIEPFSDSEELRDIARAFPNLIPFAGPDPRRPGAADRLDGLLRAGARGVKCHPILQETAPDDPAWRPLAEVARAHGVPMLFHCGSYRYHVEQRPSHRYATPLRFEPLLAEFPGITFVLAHCGLHESADALAVASRHENVILETSFQHRSILRQAFAAVGASRLVFGSDFPGSDVAAPLRELTAAAPSTADLEAALWRNAERLLRLPAA